MMPINTQRRITELIDENYAYAAILYYFGIKFYDYDEQTLSQVCQERGLNVKQVIEGLESVYHQPPGETFPLASFPVDIIIAYLKHTHSVFIKDRLPYLSKIIHTLYEPAYQTIVDDLQFVFPLFVEEIIHHIFEEEDEFFSYILLLQESLRAEHPPVQVHYKMEKYAIQEFAVHHDIDDDEMEGIRNITNGYATDHIDSLHLRVVYAELQQFERELQIHASVENEILFPKALMLEKQVKKILREKVKLN